MKKILKELEGWCCKDCGYIDDYDISHCEYSDGECCKFKNISYKVGKTKKSYDKLYLSLYRAQHKEHQKQYRLKQKEAK